LNRRKKARERKRKNEEREENFQKNHCVAIYIFIYVHCNTRIVIWIANCSSILIVDRNKIYIYIKRTAKNDDRTTKRCKIPKRRFSYSLVIILFRISTGKEENTMLIRLSN